jgi:UDP-N-acetylmuramyl pentapeptide phosphotransferase/UDP-N-acetylglucosamine-1-phosphate transferase
MARIKRISADKKIRFNPLNSCHLRYIKTRMLQYLFVSLILLAGIILYFKIADKYNIIDKPNQRSSHNYITIRGGGIVFWLAGIVYFVIKML